MKKYLIVCILWLTAVCVWSQTPWRVGYSVWPFNMPAPAKQQGLDQWYREILVTIEVDGRSLYYYMYDTYTYNDGDGEEIVAVIFNYMSAIFWNRVEFLSMEEIHPNNDLAQSVKDRMLKGGYDISATLILNRITVANAAGYGRDYYFSLYINNYNKSNGVWSTYIIDLVYYEGA